VRVERVAAGYEDIAGLAELLLDSVASGASVGFLADLSPVEASVWWRTALTQGGGITWVARDDDGTIVGCVRLLPAQYPNSAHRAEVSKLLVHSKFRQQGIAGALLQVLEKHARESGRLLLMLDTETGSTAEEVYRRWGWQEYGVIEHHAATPDGDLKSSTFFIKWLDGGD
jgi:GNAT superfamily N-acetyltransferase